MQTQYKLLYRYINETTRTPVTGQAEYDETNEFYSYEHKLNITPTQIETFTNNNYELKAVIDGETPADVANALINSSDEDREKIIIENMANENKSNNFFIYTGTKKVYHKKFIPTQLGYLVRDWTRVPRDQIPSSPTDFSKHFVMMGGYRLGVDEAFLVCKPQYVENYYNYTVKDKVNNKDIKYFAKLSTDDITNTTYKHNVKYYRKDTYFTHEELVNLINEECFFEWFDTENERIENKFGTIEEPVTFTGQHTYTNYTDGNVVLAKIYRGSGYGDTRQYGYFFYNNQAEPPKNGIPQDFNVSSETRFSLQSVGSGNGFSITDLTDAGYYAYGTELSVKKNNIIRYIIPEHYEDTGTAPYFIKDTYEKVKLSPWILHSVHNSLESGLTAAKKLVTMVGLDNVKLVKNVPIGQKLKIK